MKIFSFDKGIEYIVEYISQQHIITSKIPIINSIHGDSYSNKTYFFKFM